MAKKKAKAAAKTVKAKADPKVRIEELKKNLKLEKEEHKCFARDEKEAAKALAKAQSQKTKTEAKITKIEKQLHDLGVKITPSFAPLEAVTLKKPGKKKTKGADEEE